MANYQPLGIASVLLLLAVCGLAQGSVETIEDLGTSSTLTTEVGSESFRGGSGFVTMLQKDLVVRGQVRQVRLFVRAFGLSAGDLPVATLLQVDISKYQGQHIRSAYLEFDLGGNSQDQSTVTIDSFDADGMLGFTWNWNPESLGNVVADVSGVSKQRIDVTALLNNRLMAGDNWLGLRLSANSGTLLKPTLGRMGPDAAKVRLDVEVAAVAHAPEPSTLAIWSILGVALVAGRRRLFG